MRIHGAPLAIATALLAAASSAAAQGSARLSPSSPSAVPSAETRAAATHTVRMLGDEKGYRFEPASLTVSPGDRVRFVMVSGGPHNVQFLEQEIPAAAGRALGAGMPDTIGTLTGPMYMNPGESYTVSFARVPAGKYPYICTPHQAMNMRGTITVRGATRAAPSKGASKGASKRGG